MKTTGNTILITGGGSGIGRGLAEAFHALGNQVIISGRGQKTLDETTAANPGMESLTVDMTDPAGIRVVRGAAGGGVPVVKRPHQQRRHHADGKPARLARELADAEATITTNLLGPIRLTAALLPLAARQATRGGDERFLGLAFVPLA